MGNPKLSVAVSNAMLDAIETAIGPNPIMRVFSGAEPANEAAASTGTLLSTINLPSDWLGAAAGRSKSKAGTWEDAAADGTGVAGYMRIFDSTGNTCHLQGDVTNTGGGGFMTVSNVNFAVGQPFAVTGFALNHTNPA